MIILQYVQISTHEVVHLKLTQWHMPIIPLFQEILLERKFAIQSEISSGKNYLHTGFLVLQRPRQTQSPSVGYLPPTMPWRLDQASLDNTGPMPPRPAPPVRWHVRDPCNQMPTWHTELGGRCCQRRQSMERFLLSCYRNIVCTF